MDVLTAAFWIAIGLLVYTYLGYGLLVAAIVGVRRSVRERRRGADDAHLPTVTLVIAAHNEEAVLEEKLANCAALDYPSDRFRLLFVTDGSTDRSPEILASRGIDVLHRPGRAGKPSAINRALEFVDSEVVVFTDANTMLNREAIRRLARHFADPEVGAVAGEKRVRRGSDSGASGVGEGLYWRYESALKRLDSALHTVVGAAGELFAMRRSLWEPVEPDALLDDFVISLRIAGRGQRVVYEPEAYALEAPSASLEEEFKRKVRIAAGGFQSLARLAALMNPFRNGWLAFQLVSHRALRWAVAPALVPAVLLLNVPLALHGGPVYALLLAAQLLFHGAAGAGWWLRRRGRRRGWIFVPLYFDFMNFAALRGFARWRAGRQSILWERAVRAGA